MRKVTAKKQSEETGHSSHQMDKQRIHSLAAKRPAITTILPRPATHAGYAGK